MADTQAMPAEVLARIFYKLDATGAPLMVSTDGSTDGAIYVFTGNKSMTSAMGPTFDTVAAISTNCYTRAAYDTTSGAEAVLQDCPIAGALTFYSELLKGWTASRDAAGQVQALSIENIADSDCNSWTTSISAGDSFAMIELVGWRDCADAQESVRANVFRKISEASPAAQMQSGLQDPGSATSGNINLKLASNPGFGAGPSGLFPAFSDALGGVVETNPATFGIPVGSPALYQELIDLCSCNNGIRGVPITAAMIAATPALNTALFTFVAPPLAAPNAPAAVPTQNLNEVAAANVDVAVLAAVNGTALTYTATGLPAGLTINPATGVITGTPGAGTGGPVATPVTYSVVVTVTNTGGSVDVPFTISITDLPPTNTPVTPPALEIGQTGVSFDVKPFYVDPEGDTLTYTATGLPNGLTMSTDGVITGTVVGDDVVGPSTDFNVTIEATDPANNVNTTTPTFTVTPPAPPPPRTLSLEVDAINLTATTRATFTSGTLDIDWGDGTVETGIAAGSIQDWSHTYAAPGAATEVKFQFSDPNTTVTDFRVSAGKWNFDIAALDNFSRSGLETFTLSGRNVVHGNIETIPASMKTVALYGNNVVGGDIGALHVGIENIYALGNNVIGGNVNELPATVANVSVQGDNVVGGDVGALPATMSTFVLKGETVATGDFGTLPVGLTQFDVGGNNTISGDLGDLKTNMRIVSIAGSGSVTYAAATPWATPPNLRSLSLTQVGAGLTAAQLDLVLEGLALDTTWPGSAGNDIQITGANAAPTAAGLAFIATLRGNGATVAHL